MKKGYLLIVVAMQCLFTVCQAVSAQEPIRFGTQRSTYLYGTQAAEKRGDLKRIKGDFLIWQGNATLAWDIDVPQDEVCELLIIASIRADAEGETLVFKIPEKTFTFDLSPTQGPFKTGRNYQKLPLTDAVLLKKGSQRVSLATEGISIQEIWLDFRTLELVPVSARKAIAADQSRALAARPSLDWFVEAGYGLMFHWTSRSVQPDGSIKPFETAVNGFDVERFANMVEETGAGYVMFTVEHAEQHYPAPIQSWEKVHPGKTTQRDLVAELAEALNARGYSLDVLHAFAGNGQMWQGQRQGVLTEFYCDTFRIWQPL